MTTHESLAGAAQALPEQGPAGSGRGRLAVLTLGSVGVVYGDIGTSPIYAFREAVRLVAGDGITRAEVLGVVSLLLWALILIVTLKYVLFLLRADNRGEGGIAARPRRCLAPRFFSPATRRRRRPRSCTTSSTTTFSTSGSSS